MAKAPKRKAMSKRIIDFRIQGGKGHSGKIGEKQYKRGALTPKQRRRAVHKSRGSFAKGFW